MKHTIGLQLRELDRDGGPYKGVYSRGAVIQIYGTDALYLGPSPDGQAWFWLGPGDVRAIGPNQLAEHGFILLDYDEVIKAKRSGA